MSKKREHWGDRPDGVLMRNISPLHFITGILYPNRCDNEAFIAERIDLTAVNEYLEKKNYEGIPYKYNLFQVVLAAFFKTFTLREKMNRFIVNGNFYQRKWVSAGFTVKKLFADNGAEALAIIKADSNETIDSLHEKIYQQVSFCRSDKNDDSTKAMDTYSKIPRFISKSVVKFVMFLDKHGRVPQSYIKSDPYYQSFVISNVGSIKLNCAYHHLTNWGTCSTICLIGQIKNRDIRLDDGTTKFVPTVELGLTIDERIADGYYYSKTIRLLKYLLQNPELLEKPFSEQVEDF